MSSGVESISSMAKVILIKVSLLATTGTCKLEIVGSNPAQGSSPFFFEIGDCFDCFRLLCLALLHVYPLYVLLNIYFHDICPYCRYDVGRIVMVTGIPESVHKSKLRKKCSKYGPLEEFVYPVATIEEQQVEGINGKIAHVTYKNYADAHKAAIALKGLKLDGASNPLEAVLMSKEGKAPSKITLAKSRLIVRNLSFEVKSGDLKKLFSRYGSVQEVHIPRKPNGHMRGYAFVQFTSYFEAAKALEGEFIHTFMARYQSMY